MKSGDFFIQFFSERGTFEPKPNGEASVLCPFPHAKGYETRPSAHVNIEKGVFHCKTCEAEGRFASGGMSEIGFISAWYNIPYEQAVQMLASDINDEIAAEAWEAAVYNLLENTEAMKWLSDRGITEETVTTYQLGYAGDGIVYPVFMNGVLLDKRTYNWTKDPAYPKIRSTVGASPLLFPFDHWLRTEGTTLLCAGENDTLLARQHGFNAVTSTFGEGNFPELFAGMFKDKTVHICYDCDVAGRNGARKVALLLKDAGATVYMVDLGLTGTKDDKDITDFFIKRNYTADDLRQRILAAQLYDEAMFQEDRDHHYPLVDLWHVHDSRFHGKRVSSRVSLMGKFDSMMETPTAVEWACTSPKSESAPCITCPLHKRSGWWVLDGKRLDQVLELVEVNALQQEKALNRFIGIPPRCPGGVSKRVRVRKHVQKVILAPDVETEDELSGYKAVEYFAYIIGNRLDDGQRYRIYYKRYAHPLQDQNIVLVVDRVEESDSSINRFEVTPEIVSKLSVFNGDPYEVMRQRYEKAKEVVGAFANEMVAYAVDIAYHSVLDFTFGPRRRTIKGHPEGLIIGPSRTGKSDTALKMQQFYGLGNFTECKSATTAGLLGGADKLPSGGFRVKWGKIPRNHKGLLVLDELSGMPQGVMSSLTGLRSQRKADVAKIATGQAPAKTRLLWLSNPKVGPDGKPKNVEDYPNGVKLVVDLIGADEDIARFDFVYILPNIKEYTSPLDEEEISLTQEEYEQYKNEAYLYRTLIHWVWSRKPEQIKWGHGVEEYIWQTSQQLNERYDTDIKFLGAEAWKKLARIAVSCAGATFSHTDDGESILVTKPHVDWAKDFLERCYANEIFRLAEYAKQRRWETEPTEETVTIVTGLIQSQTIFMKTLTQNSACSFRQLEATSGLDKNSFNSVVNTLAKYGLIETSGDHIAPTRKLRRAIDIYRMNINQTRMTPLVENR